MITRIKNGKVIVGEHILSCYVYIEDGKILDVTEEELAFDDEIDADGAYVSAGFIDIHVHGGAGYEFVDATKESIKEAANIHALKGTTTIYPTLSAYDNEKTKKALETLKQHMNDEDIMPHIYGAHLEGPYFSPAQSGAQDPSYIRTPDPAEYKELYELYSDIIKRWDYAPELAGAKEFALFLAEKGVVASAAHTDAKLCHMTEAYEAGMKLITHLYSCTSTITRESGFRKLGVIETAYLYDDIDVETIADGCHLPPELLRLVYKFKGPYHMCLVTDAIRHGGLESIENETCENGNMPYIIEDGVAKLADRTAFAGSIATTDVLVRTCVKKAGIPLTDAVSMITEVPARIMGLKNKGRIEKGYDADIVIFDEDIDIKKVIIAK